MRAVLLILFAAAVLCGCQSEEEKKFAFLNEKVIPMAREFIKRNELPHDSNFGTNSIKKWRVDFFDDGRPGGQASFQLTNHCSFRFSSTGEKNEIWSFHEGKVNTYYDLTFAPKEKIEAVKALNLQNKLNDKTALELAKKYFKLQGHKEEDFRPVIFYQSYWIIQNGESGTLPYYYAQWFRKDSGNEPGVLYPNVTIEVSGISTNLISYSKVFMPVGSDF